MSIKTIYDYKVLDLYNNYKSLADYKGKVLLIVNTASKCHFTKQFKSLESLYTQYKDSGFEILAFPSNDFANQEPQTGNSLEKFCRIDKRATFPVFERIHVIGENQDPLYQYLTKKELNGVLNNKPLWNFHKYLIDKSGRVVDFYYPFTSPLSTKIQKRIKQLLDQ